MQQLPEPTDATLLAVLDEDIEIETIIKALRDLGGPAPELQGRGNRLRVVPPARPVPGHIGAQADSETRLEAHAVGRWAEVVVPVLDSRKDLRTINQWARFLSVSTGALRNWCHTAGISPRRSLLFGRLLRVVLLSEGGTHKPENLLDIVDRRTLSAVLRTAGFDAGRPLPESSEGFLMQQQLINDVAAIEEIRYRLGCRNGLARGRLA